MAGVALSLFGEEDASTTNSYPMATPYATSATPKSDQTVESGASAPASGSDGCSVAFAPGLSPAPMAAFPGPRSPNPACRFPAPGSPAGSCASHTDHRDEVGAGPVTRQTIAAARRPSCLPHRRRCAAEPVHASTTPNRSGSTPSLLHVTRSELSALRRGYRQSHSRRLSSFPHPSAPEAPPSAGITRRPRYYGPLRRPAGPACPSRGSGWRVPATDRVSRVATIPLYHACRRHYPGGASRCPRRSLPCRWQPSPLFGRVGLRHARFEACSTFTARCGPHGR